MTGFHLGHQTQATRVMYINSADVNKTDESTDISFLFKDAIHTRADEGMLVSVLSASVPYSFYNIRTGVNDTISYAVNTIPKLPIVLPAGNYNAQSLATQLKTLLAAATPTCDMTIVFDSKTLKYTFHHAHLHLVTLGFGGTNAPSVEFGYSETANFFPGGTHTSTTAVDVNGSVHALYVRSDLPTLSVFESHTGGVSDVLSKLPINTNPGGLISFSPSNLHESLIYINHVKGIRIRLTDEQNRLMNLNGLHFQVGIQFKFVSLKQPDKESALQLREQMSVSEQTPPRKTKAEVRKKTLRKGKAKISKAVAKASKVSSQK